MSVYLMVCVMSWFEGMGVYYFVLNSLTDARLHSVLWLVNIWFRYFGEMVSYFACFLRFFLGISDRFS